MCEARAPARPPQWPAAHSCPLGAGHAALAQGPEREKCLAQAARCRRDAKRDADLLKATAADGQHMVHPAQKLRLAFASPLPATVEAGDAFEVEVRLGAWPP